MMKLESSRLVQDVVCVIAWFVWLVACTRNVAASQALPPHPPHSTATAAVEDSSSFRGLPGTPPLDDEILRGGAAALQSFHDPLLQVDYIADTELPTDMGNFRMRAYRVRKKNAHNTHGLFGTVDSMEPIIIYAADKPPFGDLNSKTLLENVPIRIHDQCLTSEVFRSRRYVPLSIGHDDLKSFLFLLYYFTQL